MNHYKSLVDQPSVIFPGLGFQDPLPTHFVSQEDGTCTQMYYAQQGIVTEEMAFIAA